MTLPDTVLEDLLAKQRGYTHWLRSEYEHLVSRMDSIRREIEESEKIEVALHDQLTSTIGGRFISLN